MKDGMQETLAACALLGLYKSFTRRFGLALRYKIQKWDISQSTVQVGASCYPAHHETHSMPYTRNDGLRYRVATSLHDKWLSSVGLSTRSPVEQDRNSKCRIPPGKSASNIKSTCSVSPNVRGTPQPQTIAGVIKFTVTFHGSHSGVKILQFLEVDKTE